MASIIGAERDGSGAIGVTAWVAEGNFVSEN
jgi:hypothetical protein